MVSPLSQVSYPVTRSALVIGGGVSGMSSSLALAKQGIGVHLVERTEELGGLGLQIGETVEGDDVSGFVEDLRRQVYDHLRIQVHTGSELGSFSGYVGNFKTQIRPLKSGPLKSWLSGAGRLDWMLSLAPPPCCCFC